jgi:HEPN domain-containing protein
MASIAIKEHLIEFEPPFSAGHVLTTTEAYACNRFFQERLKRVLSLKYAEGATQEEIQAYSDAYFPIMRKKVDPVMEEAKRIARSIIAETLNKHGKTLPTSGRGLPKVLRAIDKLIDSRPDIMDQARKAVAENNRVFDAILEDSDV